MSAVILGALAAFLLYLALRVLQMRRSLSFAAAYLVFVLVFLGGSVGVFVAATHIAAGPLGLDGEDPRALVGIYGATALGALVLWFVARALVGRDR